MIATDGKQTIANHPATRETIARNAPDDFVPSAPKAACPHCGETDPDVFFDTPGDELAWCYRCGKHSPSQLAQAPRRGAQDNGQQWNDDRCACGNEICDSPAGDKCWDCFNHDPSE